MGSRGLAAVLFSVVVTLGFAAQQPCDVTKSGEDMCDNFCNHRCGFYNTSRGETGEAQRVTVYRLTDVNVTGLRNKNSGDPLGDISFWLSHKQVSQRCIKAPAAPGCFHESNHLYGKFTVETDGQWGPYLLCGAEQRGGPDPIHKPHWKDTRKFHCGPDCLSPTETGCNPGHLPYPLSLTNQTDDGWFGPKCYCDGTKRHLHTAGRSEPTFLASGGGYGQGGVPASWVPQCQSSDGSGYKQVPDGKCLTGTEAHELHAWSFESASSMACDACREDIYCTGWSTRDNRTVQLFRGNTSTEPGSCTGATLSNGGKFRKTWWGVGNLGGIWYSTPSAGECPHGAPLGTGGCTWRNVASVYKEASCVDGQVDASVERVGAACFGNCSQPFDRTSDCYLDCYRDLLMGNAATNVTKIPEDDVVNPWVLAFAESDPIEGGCPEVQPAVCEGLQCESLSPSRRLSIAV